MKTRGRRERGQRERADVEDHVVERRPPRAPLHRGDRDRQGERGADAEQRGAGDRADGADRDRAVVDLERERLAGTDERDECNQPEPVRAVRRDHAERAGHEADGADDPDEDRKTPREREEARAVHRVRPRVAALEVGNALGGRGQRHDVVAVLRNRDEPALALLRHQQRLGARVEHAVAALELGAVDGEVGLVDQLVRVGSVARERGDADRDRRADRLARGLDVEGASGDRAPDPLGDLEGLFRRSSPGAGSRTPRRRSAPGRRSGAAASGRPRRCPGAPRRRRDGRRCC